VPDADSIFDDDDFDDEDAEVLARLRAAERRVRTTPPRCLSGFTTRPSSLKGVRFDGHGEPLNVVYQVACACGHDAFRALGHRVTIDGYNAFVSPLALECAACGKVTELFDAAEHGYDPEVCGHSYAARGTGPREPFACGHCRGEVMTAHARFEHSSETLEDSTGEFTGREHDLFTWFTLVGECRGCGGVLEVADFECA